MSAVTWEIGVFGEGDAHSSVTGRFTHAFVDRPNNQSAPSASAIRAAIEALTSQRHLRFDDVVSAYASTEVKSTTANMDG